MINSSTKITNTALGAPKIMINEPNMMNTAINDLYATQKIGHYSHATTSGSGLVKTRCNGPGLAVS